MNKPLKDWTIGELMQYCDSQARCLDCDFLENEYTCAFYNSNPNGWHDPRKPKFTEEEQEDAKAIMRIFEGFSLIERVGCDLFVRTSANSKFITLLVPTRFPPIKDCESYTLAEIAGCE